MSFLAQPITLTSLFGKKRMIGSIKVNVTVSEATNDTLTITKQPVQFGASITDHAYKEPTSFSMNIRFSDNLSISLSKTYQQLQDLQNSRVPFDVVTPKRLYPNMLISVLSMTTDKQTENCLAINISFQQVIIVQVSTTSVPPRTRQRNPGKTGATENGGRKSALLQGAQGAQSFGKFLGL